jgi:hypothetical protein
MRGEFLPDSGGVFPSPRDPRIRREPDGESEGLEQRSYEVRMSFEATVESALSR